MKRILSTETAKIYTRNCGNEADPNKAFAYLRPHEQRAMVRAWNELVKKASIGRVYQVKGLDENGESKTETIHCLDSFTKEEIALFDRQVESFSDNMINENKESYESIWAKATADNSMVKSAIAGSVVLLLLMLWMCWK